MRVVPRDDQATGAEWSAGAGRPAGTVRVHGAEEAYRIAIGSPYLNQGRVAMAMPLTFGALP